MNKFRWLLLLFVVKFASATDFLPLWQAFQVKVAPENHQIIWVKFDIAPEYHVYQDKINIVNLPNSGVKLGKPILPDPVILHSKDIGDFKVYENKLALEVPITSYGNGELKLQINYQGCKGLDLCFPEQKTTLMLDLNKPSQPAQIYTPTELNKPNTAINPTNKTSLAQLWNLNGSANAVSAFFSNSPLLVVCGFFILGLLIAFTPCVFPLFPILLGVISGAKINTRRSFILALSYILGGAVTYAIAGVIAAAIGFSFATALQADWISWVLAVVFMLFALSLFDLYSLQLPLNLQNKLNQMVGSRNNGSLFGAFMIGGVSNLILSPCVTAPLAGALIYISSSGNLALGGLALFALGFGSGIPLLVIAVFGKHWLPKSGNWMVVVKKLLGIVMLAMAFYVISKVLIEAAVSYLILIWILISCGVILPALLVHYSWKLKTISIGLINLLIIGFFIGSGKLSMSNHASSISQQFTVVTTPAELDLQLANAKKNNQPILLDYYAKWCLACKEMDIDTFTNPKVIDLLKNYHIIRVDVTANNSDTLQMQRQYQVIASPSLVFLRANGTQLSDYNVTGFINSHQLSMSLQAVLVKSSAVNQECGAKKC